MNAAPPLPRDDLATAAARPRFNLADEPWLPVLAGSQLEMWSLRQLFADGHHVADLLCDTEPARWAVRFFLAALTQDMVGHTDPRAELPDRFDPVLVEEYFDAVAHRLFLFHPTDPFLQQAALPARIARDGQVPVHSVKTLSVHLGAAGRHTWWDHVPDRTDDGWFSLPPATAARLVITRALFGEQGNEQRPDGSAAGASPPAMYAARDGAGCGLLIAAPAAPTLARQLLACLPPDRGASRFALPDADLTSPEGTYRPPGELSVIEAKLWTPKATWLVPEDPEVRFVLRAARAYQPAGDQRIQRDRTARAMRAGDQHIAVRCWEGDTPRFAYGNPRHPAWRRVLGRAPAGASAVADGLEVLTCSYSGSASTSVLRGWRREEIPAALVCDPAVSAVLAALVDDDGLLTGCETALEECGRRCLLPPLRDASGRHAVDWASPLPPLAAEVVERFWLFATDAIAALAAELVDGTLERVPASFGAAVRAECMALADELCRTAVGFGPSRQLQPVSAHHRLAAQIEALA